MNVATRAKNQLKEYSDAQLVNTNLRLGGCRGIFAIALLVLALMNRLVVNNGNGDLLGLYLALAYLVYTGVMFVLSRTIARQSARYPRFSLFLDALLITIVSWFIGMPVFGIAYLPALLLAATTGLTESAIAVAVVGIANIVFLVVNPKAFSYNLVSAEGLAMLAVFATALFFPIILFMIAKSSVVFIEYRAATGRQSCRKFQRREFAGIAEPGSGHLPGVQHPDRHPGLPESHPKRPQRD